MPNGGSDPIEEQTIKFYQDLVATLGDAFQKEGDPSLLVLENYLKWKGLPTYVARLASQSKSVAETALAPAFREVSPHFTVIGYPLSEGIVSLCTLGASYKTLPGSDRTPDNQRGLRLEYIMHTKEEYQVAVSELLLKIAGFPFLADVTYAPGHALYLGEPVVPGSPMDHLYLSYPYLDDPRIYEENPFGQIQNDRFLIQTLWVWPVCRSEVDHLATAGVDAFEHLAFEKHAAQYDAFDFFRQPYV